MRTKFRNIINRHLTAEKWNFVLAIICTLIVAVADLLRPWPLKLIIDNVLLGKSLPHSLRTLETFFINDKVWTIVAVASLLILISAVKGFSVYAQTSNRSSHRRGTAAPQSPRTVYESWASPFCRAISRPLRGASLI